MIGIICIICLFTIIFGLYRMYKDEHENYVKSHVYREPKFDKEKAKKEIYKYLKESYHNKNLKL